MKTNDQMKPDRYLRWHKARQLHRRIVEHLASGGQVMVATHTRVTIFKTTHVDYFKAERSGLYARYGKRWDCIDYCAIRFSK